MATKMGKGLCTSVILPDGLKARIDAAAEKMNISTSEYIRRAAQMVLDTGVTPGQQTAMRRYSPGHTAAVVEAA